MTQSPISNLRALAVGRFIRRLRRESGMSQRILGKDVGCSQSYIGLIELGKHVPRPEIRRRLCASLDLGPADVAHFDDLTRSAAPVRRGSPSWKALIKPGGFQPGGGDRRGREYRYRKGNTPWNKGRKGLYLSPATEFQPGSLHGAAARKLKPIGSVTTRRDKTCRKRRWIKVRPHGNGRDAYIPLARHLYELEHGPIPTGTFVVHADGDTLNDDPDNLLLMDRRRLIAWQQRIRPKMKENRKRRLAAASRKRWADYRAIRDFREKRYV